jgi:hypothetical protein
MGVDFFSREWRDVDTSTHRRRYRVIIISVLAINSTASLLIYSHNLHNSILASLMANN